MIKFVILALCAFYVTPTHGIKYYLCKMGFVEKVALSQVRSSIGIEDYNKAFQNAPECSKDFLGTQYNCPEEGPNCGIFSNPSADPSMNLVMRSCTPLAVGCKLIDGKKVCACESDLCNIRNGNGATLPQKPSMFVLGALREWSHSSSVPLPAAFSELS